MHFNADAPEHRALIPNHSLSELAQYLRSSLKLVWRMRTNTYGKEDDLRQVCFQSKWKDNEKCEYTRSELIGTDSEETAGTLETDC